jgi:hypothetical protein
MNSPKARPSLLKDFTPKVVGAGSHRLPGAVVLLKPSTKMTKTRITVEKIPKIEVYDRRERGRKTVGMKLK